MVKRPAPLMKTQFRKILFSYIIILLLPIFVSFFFYWNSAVTVANKSAEIARLSVEDKRVSIDALFSQLYTLAKAVVSNESVQICSMGNARPELTRADAGGKAAQFLRDTKANNNAISDIYVYCSRTGELITCTGRYRSNLEQHILREMGFGGVDISRFITDHFTDTVVVLESGNLYVMCPLLIEYETTGAVFIRIDTNAISAIIQKSTAMEGILNIHSPDGYVYPKNSDAITPVPGTTSWWPFTGNEITMSRISSVSPLEYVVQIPLQSYRSGVDKITIFIILYNLLCLAAGGLLAYIYTRRNYLPLERLLKTVGGGTADISVESAIKEVETRYRKYHTYAAEHAEQVRSRVLIDLLHGDDCNDVQVLAAAGIPFDTELAVAAVNYEDHGGTLFQDGELNSFEQESLVGVIIRSITEEILSEHGLSYMSVYDNEIACVFTSDDWQAVPAMLERASIVIEENFGLLVTFGISRRCNESKQLPSAYREALDALDYTRMTSALSRCIRAEDISATTADSDFTRLFLQLTSALMERDYAAAGDCLIHIQSGMERWSVSELKRRSELLAGLATEFAIVDAVEGIGRKKDIQLLLSLFTGELESHRSQQAGQLHSELTHRAKKYIDEHYMEYSLDVSKICSALRISQSHLSREFKREVGMTLTEYIGQQRLCEAKRLLAVSDMNIKEIALRVGCPDPRALTHLFRETVGFSANEYRKYICSLINS